MVSQGSDVLTAMKADILVFSLMIPCSQGGVRGHSGGIYCISNSFFPEDGCSFLFWTVGTYIPTFLQATLTSRPLTQSTAVIDHSPTCPSLVIGIQNIILILIQLLKCGKFSIFGNDCKQ
jgi:hypothetical protein